MADKEKNSNAVNPYAEELKCLSRREVSEEPVFDFSRTGQSQDTESDSEKAGNKDTAVAEKKADKKPDETSEKAKAPDKKSVPETTDEKTLKCEKNSSEKVRSVKVKGRKKSPGTVKVLRVEDSGKKAEKSEVSQIKPPEVKDSDKSGKSTDVPEDKCKNAGKQVKALKVPSKSKEGSESTKEKEEAEKADSADAVSEKPAKKKLSVFSKAVMIYSGVLVAAAAVVLIVLYSFLSAFEHSRPLNCISDYISGIEANGLPAECSEALNGIDENIRSREDSLKSIEGILPELSYGKSGKLSTAESPAYILSYNKKPVGTVYLSAMYKHPFGLTFWEVDRAEYDFSAFEHSHSVVVPADYSVIVNGKELGSEYITENNIEYESLSSFYQYYNDLPRLVNMKAANMWVLRISVF